jgi:hypothetical protein
MVVGVVLVMWGRNMAYSLGGHVHYVFTGAPSNKALNLLVGGGLLIAFGFYQAFWKAR